MYGWDMESGDMATTIILDNTMQCGAVALL